VTTVSVTGSNFPTGTINATSVTLSLQPMSPGPPAGSTPATSITTITGTTRRVTFTIPTSLVVSSPIAYQVSLSGQTTTGALFASSNKASLTVNPPAAISTVLPALGAPGQHLSVAITGTFTSFVQGSTQASFGAGIAVGGGPSGGFGPVTVGSSTSATAQLAIGSAAALGIRTVSVRTGLEQAAKTGGFDVATGAPQITDFSPKSAAPGALVTVTGTNLVVAPGVAPSVLLNQEGGGVLSAPVISSNSGSVEFVIPNGAVTGSITVSVGGQTVTSAVPLSIIGTAVFNVSAMPASVNLIRGQTIGLAVQVIGAGLTNLAALSVAGLPLGVSGVFKPGNVMAGQLSVLTLTGPANQSLGTSTVTVNATAVVNGISLSQSSAVQLTVIAPSTSLAGRTVVSDSLETPVSGVTIKMLGKDGNGNVTGCTGTGRSDSAGNFVLVNLGLNCVGPQLVGFDGTTATSPAGTYAGVNLAFTLSSGQVTASPVLVHLPRIDNQETFNVQQNAATNQTYSYKTIPGLSVTVYAGTTFTLADGSKPNPFPLTAVNVPVDRLPDLKPPVPTMLSVFIVAFQPANAFTNQPVAVYYPNLVNTPAGTNGALMTLDPTHGVMVPYGTATVSNDGSQFIPDLDPAYPGHRFGLLHFDWHMVGTPLGNQTNPCGGFERCPCCGDPVDLSTGLAVIRETDLSFGGARGNITLERVYRNGISAVVTTFGPFGYGTNHNWNYELDSLSPSTASVINLIMPDGNRFSFSKQGDGRFVNSGIPRMGGGVMSVNGPTVDLRWKNGTTFEFTVILVAPFLRTLLTSVTDANGNRIQVVRNGFNISDIVDPVGRALHIDYNGGGCITRITAPDGRFVSYDYGGGALCTNAFQSNVVAVLRVVTHPDGTTTRYDYDGFNNLTAVTDGRGIVVASNTYDANNRVIRQRLANGGILQFSYTLQNPLAGLLSPVLATTVTDTTENQTTYRFSPAGAMIGATDALGQTRTIDRDGGNYVTALSGSGVCPECGNVGEGDQSFAYDDSTGNLLSATDALGHTTVFTYEPVFNRVTSIEDPLGNITSFTYDGNGNVLQRKDPNGNITSYQHDQFGELTAVTDATQQTTAFGYDTAGNLTAMRDSLGHVTTMQYDVCGRLLTVRDPLGRTTSFAYDPLDRLTAQTNPQNGITRLAYDQVGNLLSVTDARNSQTVLSYDLMNRLVTRKTALGGTDNRTYDLAGNLLRYQDRRGQVSIFSYDAIYRLIAEAYQDGSSVARAYDANSRLTAVNDTASGIFDFSYDLAGRVLTATMPTGAVQYTRDSLGRVLTRQVIGQPTVTYSYDPAGNLKAAGMPQVSASFTYDARNLLSSVSRANGVTSTYGYDSASRLLDISHHNGPNILDDETYAYDAVGNRIGHTTLLGESLATPAAPNAVYDSDNQQLQLGPTANTFDANGNLVSSVTANGTSTFTWDSRNRLKSMVTGAGQTTTFSYDFSGNLLVQTDTGPTLNLTKTFVLDELTNVVYQTASDGSAYSVLSGQAVDSHLAIAQSSGQVQYGLSDAVNSTVATVDQSGAIRSTFLYEPFGQTTLANGSYPFRYTGRVPVSDSLYYYRARFYNSQTGRFISEDPIGFGGGDVNLYRYVGNAPTGLTDPTGLTISQGAINHWPTGPTMDVGQFCGYAAPVACAYAGLFGGVPGLVCGAVTIPLCHLASNEPPFTFGPQDLFAVSTLKVPGALGLACGEFGNVLSRTFPPLIPPPSPAPPVPGCNPNFQSCPFQ